MQRKIVLGTVGILAAMLLIWAFAFVEPYQLHGSEIVPSIPPRYPAQTALMVPLRSYGLRAESY